MASNPDREQLLSEPPDANRTTPLTRLPLELLAEILSFTSTPRDLLSVARTCKALCYQLLSPGAAYIWKNMRDRIGLPDPARFKVPVKSKKNPTESFALRVRVEPFVGREAAYAAFVFDGGWCQSCGERTDSMYASYSLRVRLCNMDECMEEWFRWSIEHQRLILRPTHNVPDGPDLPTYFAWSTVPVLEHTSNLWLYFATPPDGVTRFSLLEKEKLRLNLKEREGLSETHMAELSFENYSQSQQFSAGSKILTEASYKKLKKEKGRANIWIRFCNALLAWQSKWRSEIKTLTVFNKDVTMGFANDEKWEYSELMEHSSFGRLFECKILDRERIEPKELDRLRPIVARELRDFHEKQDRTAAKHLREKNIDHIWKYYQKLMSRTNEYPTLPSFPVFLTLPSVQFLRSPALSAAKISVETATADTGFMKDMIKHEIGKWEEQVKIDLLKTLDPSGALLEEWKKRVPTSREVHPVNRLDARWKCRICDTVENRYARDECLDFMGVCRHQCKESGGKKRKGKTTRPWSIDNFVKDQQACDAIRLCLQQLCMSPENEKLAVREIDWALWICKRCDPPLLLRSSNLLGHSHRHTDEMILERVSSEAGIWSSEVIPTPSGLTQWLVWDSRGTAKSWIRMKNYACCHCMNAIVMERDKPTPEGQLPDFASQQMVFQDVINETEKLDFNGLRSHLAAKHKVHIVHDEDYYCYQDVVDYRA
ncbi:hypothetical protein AN958_03919 [Leucoagaricus sp. SymC.cos]|nr:hypothetical protein AN958_03919 [Leucoagaricus sp. SymC.cos]